MNPLLSICIPTYNRLPYLRELLDALLPQINAVTNDGVELVISNNVSTDGTDEFCRSLTSPCIRYWVNETNIGGDRNFLKCIREARGEYIWLVGDDDLICPNAVSQILAILRRERPGLLVAVEYDKPDVAVYGNYRACLLGERAPHGLFALSHTLISSNIFRRDCFDLDVAERTLYLNYAHMFGLIRNLSDKKICVAANLMATRPVRADFAKYPSFLCIKHAIYFWFLARTFDLSRYRWYAVRSACNLPMEFGSRIKHALIKLHSRLCSSTCEGTDITPAMSKRILYVTSKVFPWFESQDAAEHFRNAPYSIDAIGYNLTKLGWTVGWMGRKTATSLRSVARRIDAFRPDIVYTYGSTVALHPLLCRKFLCRHKDFKIVHGWDDHYGRIWGDLFGWPGRVLMDWLEKRIVKNSDGVVTLSHELQTIGRKWGVSCEYIPNGADPLPPAFDLQPATLKLNGSFNLVYTGDKAKWKRTADICRAMRELPKDVKLYLTGRNEDYLKPYASDNCIFLGWLSKEDQFAVMSQADAFVCTSDQDCNAKLQEYLRWKKPILCFDGEANNFFRNGHNALLAKDGDYAPLIRRLIAEPDLGPTLAANAAREIPVYTWSEIARMFDDYFARI